MLVVALSGTLPRDRHVLLALSLVPKSDTPQVLKPYCKNVTLLLQCG